MNLAGKREGAVEVEGDVEEESMQIREGKRCWSDSAQVKCAVPKRWPFGTMTLESRVLRTAARVKPSESVVEIALIHGCKSVEFMNLALPRIMTSPGSI